MKSDVFMAEGGKSGCSSQYIAFMSFVEVVAVIPTKKIAKKRKRSMLRLAMKKLWFWTLLLGLGGRNVYK